MSTSSKGQSEQTRRPGGVNALRLLELLVGHREGLGIRDMSTFLDMDDAQVHRLANGLRIAGYVAKTTTSPPRYLLTPKLLRLAAQLIDQSNLIQVSRPVMLELREAVNETVLLAAIVDSVPFSVARELSAHPVAFMTPIGEVFAFNETAMGWVLGAFLKSDVPQLAPDTAARYEEIRRKCYAIERNAAHFPSLVGCAAPIVDLYGGVVGGIAVGGPAIRMPDTPDFDYWIGGLTRAAARKISLGLGGLLHRCPE